MNTGLMLIGFMASIFTCYYLGHRDGRKQGEELGCIRGQAQGWEDAVKHFREEARR